MRYQFFLNRLVAHYLSTQSLVFTMQMYTLMTQRKVDYNHVEISFKTVNYKVTSPTPHSTNVLFLSLKGSQRSYLRPLYLSHRHPTSPSLGYARYPLDSPDCSHHSEIKMENDRISLPARPDTLSAADSTTAYTLASFFCSLDTIYICWSDESCSPPSYPCLLQEFSLKAFELISSLPHPIKHQRQWYELMSCNLKDSPTLVLWEIFGKQDSSSAYVLGIRMTRVCKSLIQTEMCVIWYKALSDFNCL